MTGAPVGAGPALRRRPLRLGRLELDLPVVLAPMAGVTGVAFRQLCREQARGRGLFVCEMITSRALVERDRTTLDMLAFAPDEPVRSVQLYGVDPVYVGKAVEILCAEYGVGHVDLNFGCPVPKVTRQGGGAALPWKRGLLASILSTAVNAAERYRVPVTAKTRIGIDADHRTFLDTGRIAQEAGCAAISLHGRTAEQHYSGAADWNAIGELVSRVEIPVLGNGDIWEAEDALAMVAETGCSGVVVGRGCLGRPWLFGDLAAAFDGSDRAGEGEAVARRRLPNLGEVGGMMRRHAELLVHYAGEVKGCREFRKHVSWYLKGFSVPRPIRVGLSAVATLAELDAGLAEFDADQPFPVEELGRPRGRQGMPKRVHLPDGWLDDTDGTDGTVSADAELAVSGG